MAETAATQASRGHRTICLPIPEPTYHQVIDDPRAFRRTIDDCFRRMPELFPANFQGYQLMGHRLSAKRGAMIRRVRLRDGTAYSIRPAFLMPYMTARAAEVQGPLFLRKFGVPFWALARVFGKTHMAWCRLECALGRFSVVGTTVRRAALPAHLRADEHPQSRGGRRLGGRRRGLQVGGPRRHGRVRAPDREHRRLEGDPSGVEAVVPDGGDPALLLACVAQDPRPGQAVEGGVCGGLPAGLGGVSRARSPALRATAAPAEAVGGRAADGGRAGGRPGPV